MSRLPLELCALVIDAAGVGRAAGRWDDGHTSLDQCCISTLKACSRVCRAWYYHAIPYLWASLTIDIQFPRTRSNDQRLLARREWWGCPTERWDATLPLANVLAIFRSNQRLMTSVRHFSLEFSSTVRKEQLSASPELVAFCKALAPLPRFSWKVDKMEDNTIFTPSYEVGVDDDHLLGQIVTPFCHSPTLTTFAFSGEMFPLDILKAMPNLKDASFTDVPRCMNPTLSDQSSSLQSLPFRLRRARFWGAEAVYAILIRCGNVFSQLEELSVSNGDYAKTADDDKLAALVSLPKGMFKIVDVELNNSRAFAQGFITRGLSLDSFKTVESCSIRITDFDKFVTFQRRAALFDILEAAPEGLFDKLESFELYLSFVNVSMFNEVFDPEHRGWRIAKDLLGPGAAPVLKTLSITVAWFGSSDTQEDSEVDHDTASKRISSRCIEMLERCVPGGWENDFRSVERLFQC